MESDSGGVVQYSLPTFLADKRKGLSRWFAVAVAIVMCPLAPVDAPC